MYMYVHTHVPLLRNVTLFSHTAHLVEVSQGFFLGHKHLGKLCALVWVKPHHVAEEEHVVWCVANLLGIQDDLLVLTSLGKALDDLHVCVQ